MILEDLDYKVLSDIFNKACEKVLSNKKEEGTFYDFDQEYLTFSFLFIFMKKMSLTNCGEDYEQVEEFFIFLITKLMTLIENSYIFINSESALDSFFTRRLELLESSFLKEVKDLSPSDFFVFLSTQFQKSNFTQLNSEKPYARFCLAYIVVVLRLFFANSILKEKDLRGAVDLMNMQYKNSHKPLLDSVFFGPGINRKKKEIRCLSDLPVYQTILN